MFQCPVRRQLVRGFAVGVAFAALLGCETFEPPKGLPGERVPSNTQLASSPFTASEIAALYAGSATCVGIGAKCSSYEDNHCCKGMFCADSKCLAGGGAKCAAHSNCASGQCNDGYCAASALSEGCLDNKDCNAADGLNCSSVSDEPGTCKRKRGATCTSSSHCMTGNCDATGHCGCGDKYDHCSQNSDCCSSYQCFLTSSGSNSAWCHE